MLDIKNLKDKSKIDLTLTLTTNARAAGGEFTITETNMPFDLKDPGVKFSVLGMNVNRIYFEKDCAGGSGSIEDTGRGIVRINENGCQCGAGDKDTLLMDYDVGNRWWPSVITMSWSGTKADGPENSQIWFTVDGTSKALVYMTMRVDNRVVLSKTVTLTTPSHGRNSLSLNDDAGNFWC